MPCITQSKIAAQISSPGCVLHQRSLVLYVKFRRILGPLGPKFDSFCVNGTMKMTLGTFGLSTMRNHPSVIFVVFFCMEAIKFRPQWTQYWLRFHITDVV